MEENNKITKIKKKKTYFLFIVVLSILFLSCSINILRILFTDKLSNIEVYHYPNTVKIVYDNEERQSSVNTYFINTYLRNLFVYRIKEEKALEIINSPKMILTLEGYKFYLSENDEIVFALHTQIIRKRSIIDKIFMIIFYDNDEYLYYSTKSNEEHFKKAIAWFRILEKE